ncbi:type II CAAX endopeptidase family protein [Dyella telluris]|uniref:CPBP family intramembrane metalloprotease n=1 Tax=Dyella telluris TaxID=2763498 RepID=A0A7G8Q6J3_9GAMM|nr:type II CAAX endopeptidase family protein [Dyella telluris]QNK02401.1 CPBP family intramembrane metalloprotease [Dyella telluris]
MTEHFPASRRALVYLAVTFGITWVAWGVLAALAQRQITRYGTWPFMVLYVLGGLGPTIAAYIAVRHTPEQAPMSEFNRRVLRWRVRPVWYLLALGLPVALGFMAIGIAVALKPALGAAVSFKPWYLFPLYLLMTIVGGGLEEFGWRGITQDEWARSIGPLRAALLIAPIWALWHLPLFFLPGVAQYHGNFALFLAGQFGIALLLGWLYTRTQSILLCVLMHAASNAVVMMGVFVPTGMGMGLTGPCLGLAVGLLLFLSMGSRANGQDAAMH